MRWIQKSIGRWKTLYFNFKCLPFREAIQFPIKFSHSASLRYCDTKIKIHGPLSRGMIRIGFGDRNIPSLNPAEKTRLDIRGQIVFHGRAYIGQSSAISVAKSATLTFGENFHATGDLSIVCRHSITFGRNAMISYRTHIRDSDSHPIYSEHSCGSDASPINPDTPITIADRVWIGYGATILKGSEIPSDTIVAACALIAKKYTQPHTILAGNPAKKIKENIRWEK